MIGRLSGRLARKTPQEIILDVRGVGYRVQISLTTFYDLPDEGAEIAVETYTVVREDAIHLFGFAGQQEKLLFERLIAVSRIGPKLALNILSGMSAVELTRAITGGDVARLATVPGVGVRTAERMVVELRDKLTDLEAPAAAAAPGSMATGGSTHEGDDAVSALVNLGYRRREAEKAVARVRLSGESGIEDLIRRALADLSA